MLHYLVEPVACTPSSGWEKGLVENQVRLVRERLFTPRIRVKSYDELNSLLLVRVIAFAKAHPHFDNIRYSVAASAIGRPVEVRAYAERVEIRQDGRFVAEHARVFGRNQTVFDPRRAAQRRPVQGLCPACRPRPRPMPV